MLKLKIGLDLAGLRQPFKQALHTAAGLGADAVEFEARGDLSPRELSQTGVRQIRKMLEDLNLRVSAVSFRTRRGLASPEQLEARLDATRAALELAFHLGTPVLVTTLGPIPSDQDPQARRLLLEVLSDFGRYAQRAGAMLAIETGNESGKTLAALLAELPQASLGIDLNPGKLLVHGFSPLEAVAVLGPSIVHVHVSDARHGPAPGRDEYVAVGRGDADFPALLGALEEQHYRGYFTVQLPAAIDPVRQAEEAILYLKGM